MPIDTLDESKQETLTNLSEQAPAEDKAVEDFFDTDEIFLQVLATAHHELHQPIHTFAWGAIAAGLIIGMSFLAQAVVTTALPEGSAYGLLGNLLYTIGFIIVILGRYPLYNTENTFPSHIDLYPVRQSARPF